MAGTNKTRATNASVSLFLETVSETRRAEAQILIDLFGRVSEAPPVLWGLSIIGFGSYDYRYASGRTGTSLRIGFAPRKSELVIYVVPGFDGLTSELLAIGPQRHEKSCLYIKSLSKTNLPALEALAAKVWAIMAQKYPQ